jgi:hypothetical protein
LPELGAEQLPRDLPSEREDSLAASPQNLVVFQPPASPQPPPEALLLDEPVSMTTHMQLLVGQLERLVESNEKLVRHIRRQMFTTGLLVSFVRGMTLGLGWVIGKTIVVGALVYFLQSFISVPVIGEFVHQIIQYLQNKPH